MSFQTINKSSLTKDVSNGKDVNILIENENCKQQKVEFVMKCTQYTHTHEH